VVKDNHKLILHDDKWQQLRNYCKSKGLCFVCGEKWSREHQCRSTVQLHVVQEMMEFLSEDDPLYYECAETEPTQQLLCVSATAQGREEVEQTMQITMEIQGVTLRMLIDSGSSHSFLNLALQHQFQGISGVRPIPVKIANGNIIHCHS
jgi:hypothetical protein